MSKVENTVVKIYVGLLVGLSIIMGLTALVALYLACCESSFGRLAQSMSLCGISLWFGNTAYTYWQICKEEKVHARP